MSKRPSESNLNKPLPPVPTVPHPRDRFTIVTPSSIEMTARPSGLSGGRANSQANGNDDSPPSPDFAISTSRQQAIASGRPLSSNPDETNTPKPRDLVSELKASRDSLKEAALRLVENKTDNNPDDPSYDLLRACAMLSGSLSATLVLVDKNHKLKAENERSKARNDRFKAENDRLKGKERRTG